jgi:hypothetical protein
MLLAIHRVFHNTRYSGMAGLRGLLPWTLCVNLASATVIMVFARYCKWRRGLDWIVSLDSLTGLFPFFLIGCMRVPDASSRLHLFGLVYALFIFSKCFTLVGYALANAPEGERRGPVRLWVFASSLLIYAGISPWVALAAWPDADEPHYLLLTHSLVVDRDFDMANNYELGHYKSFYPPDLKEQHTLRNRRGEAVPIHDVGISVLLVPGYLVAGRIGAMLELNVFAALLALAIYELALQLGATHIGAVTCWATFAFTSPLVVYSSQIYPEVVGGAITAWAAWGFSKFLKSQSYSLLVLVPSILALLPWLSIRYWMILMPMLLIFGLYVVAHRTVGDWNRRLIFLATLIGPILVSLGLFALFSLRHYGTAVPNAGYVLLVRTLKPSLFASHPGIGLLGLFLDRTYGLLTTAPIYIIALAGTRSLLRTRRWEAAMLLFTATVYIVFAALKRDWFGGWAPPSRYIFVATALLATSASLPFSRPRFSLFQVPLMAWSLVIAVAYTAYPLTRYSFWDASTGSLSQFARAQLGLDFGVVFPSFIRAGIVDYLLSAFWAMVAMACVCLVYRSSSSPASS